MYDPRVGRWLSQDPLGFEAGDPNLYRFVGNAPVNAMDLSGLAPQPAELKGNAYGDWEYEFAQIVPRNPTYSWQARVRIIFKPNNKVVRSTRINFIQVVRITDEQAIYNEENKPEAVERMTKGHYFVDANVGDQLPWYGRPGDNRSIDGFSIFVAGFGLDERIRSSTAIAMAGSRPFGPLEAACLMPRGSAQLLDTPAYSHLSMRFEFETVAISEAGPDAGKIYGAINWGILVGQNRPIRLQFYKPLFHDRPPEYWVDAVRRWNQQARYAGLKNAPGQMQVGPFEGVNVSPHAPPVRPKTFGDRLFEIMYRPALMEWPDP
jgi:hypothetical protein